MVLIDTLNLSLGSTVFLTVICLAAGVIRGFTGFALSALVMAMGILILPPIELIPLLWWLEMSASLLMLKGGWAEADRRMSFGLVVGSAIGLPLGLILTLSISEDISKLAALMIICGLAVAQLSRLRLRFLASTPGLLGSGLTAGVVTGMSGAGGMIVALYTLALDMPARVIRASLVLYLFAAICVGLATHILLGTMDAPAVARGILFAVPTMVGVFIGQALFNERFEPYYKPICLWLLIGLAGVGILRELAT